MNKPKKTACKSITISPLTKGEKDRINKAVKQINALKGEFVKRALIKAANEILKGDEV
jgi:hypothetical protein